MSVEYYRNQHVQLLADCAKLRARLAERDRQLKESVDHEVEYERRIAQLEAKLNQIVMASSYRCEESVETLEAAMAFIKMTAREALAPKEPTALDRGGEHE
jgi:septal ring factor EnvC (AmiA/AmiB activator)